MMQNTSFGPLVSLLLLLFVFIISTNHLTGIDDILKLWMYLRRLRQRERAISEFIIIIIRVYYIY